MQKQVNRYYLPQNLIMHASACPSRIHAHNFPAPSRLFSLPPEIRNHIMSLVLIQPGHRVVTNPASFAKCDRKLHRTSSGHLISPVHVIRARNMKGQISRFSFLLTCRQAYAEGLGMYYGNNTFEFRRRDLKAFCDVVPAHCRHQMRSLRIIASPYVYFGKEDAFWTALATLEGLQSLEIQSHYEGPGFHSSQLDGYRRVAHLLLSLNHFGISYVHPRGSHGSTRRSRSFNLIGVGKSDAAVVEAEINQYLQSRDK